MNKPGYMDVLEPYIRVFTEYSNPTELQKALQRALTSLATHQSLGHGRCVATVTIDNQ